jgi:hypothetical protein
MIEIPITKARVTVCTTNISEFISNIFEDKKIIRYIDMNVFSKVAVAIACILGLFLFVRILYSSSLYNAIIFFILAAVILYIYWMLASFIYGFIRSSTQFHTTDKNMEIWDNIWYTILIIFIVTILTLFIQITKSTNSKVWASFMYVFGIAFIFVFYTIMYYLYMFYEEVPKITGILTAIVVGLTGIMLLLNYLNWTLSVFYIIYGIAMVIWLMCLFLFIFYLMAMCYNWLVV